MKNQEENKEKFFEDLIELAETTGGMEILRRLYNSSNLYMKI
jgi:hypothetical protein